MNITRVGIPTVKYHGPHKGYSYTIHLYQGDRVVDRLYGSGMDSYSVALQEGRARRVGLTKRYKQDQEGL